MPEFRRTTAASLGSLTLVAALSGVGPAPATAAPATCQGQPATIVGSAPRIVGTEGADVIVAGPAAVEVHALAGDDVICVLSTLGGTFTVDAGPGDDVVDSSGVTLPGIVRVQLGAGADRLLGGSGQETVTADAAGSAEDDVVDTGAGDDDVDSGTDGFANGDVVALGAGADLVRLRATRFTGEVDAGTGESEELVVGDTEGSFTVDATAGQVHRNGEAWAPLRSAFRRFNVLPSAGLAFQGSDRGERLSVDPLPHAPKSVAMGGGDDELVLSGAPRQGDVLDGGPGSDRVTLRAAGSDLDLDLESGALETISPATGQMSATARDFEHVLLKGRRLAVRGTASDNTVLATACRTRVDSGAGADSIWVGPDYELGERSILDCPHPSFRVEGGTGDDNIVIDHTVESDDRLRGGEGDDYLGGGGGHDRIWGGPGDDRVRGGKGRDEIRGGPGRDTLWGNQGRDTLWGNRGYDRLRGGRANDRLWGGPGIDAGWGAAGKDRCRVERARSCKR